MKFKSVIFSLIMAIALSGCAMIDAPVSGLLIQNTTSPVTATSNSKGSKQGIARCTSFLGLFAFGNCSIDEAAKNGEITKIHTVDTKNISVLGIYAEKRTIVTGE